MVDSANATVPIAFVRELFAGTALDADARAALLRDAGIAAVRLDEGAARVTTDQFATLYRALARALDDELPGLFSRPVRGGTLKFLCSGMLEAASLRTALYRLTRFFRLVLDDLRLELERDGGALRIVFEPWQPGVIARTFAQEILLRVIHGVSSWLVGRKIPLARIDFTYPRPAHASEYVFLYPGPAYFEQSRTAMYFALEDAASPIRQDRRTLSAFLQRAPGDWLFSSFAERVVSHRVREYLEPRLHEALGADAVARALHLSVRTLSRRLRAEGTGFQAIRDELRRDVAIRRLSGSTAPIAVIAADLGFEDATTFHRAFRAWTGSTPGAYRGAR